MSNLEDDQNSPTVSPPNRVPTAPQTPYGLRPPNVLARLRLPVSMLSEMNRTAPEASFQVSLAGTETVRRSDDR